VPYGVDIVGCTIKGTVALTFDDGPYIYTAELLDTLKRNNVRATFFITGNNGGKGQINAGDSGYRSIVERMFEDGHQIGSHSWSHQDFSLITAQQRRDQILKNEAAIGDILGFIPTYFRPPYTHCPQECMDDLKRWGYHVVSLDLDPPFPPFPMCPAKSNET
jgi:peptidoglycan/xylan/chitin deacetylase (PgdA/CDA1 family)